MLRSSKGFTLIELLIVVVIIGILAAIAIPKFANTKEKAYLSAMKSDLRNLAAAEEAYFADYLTYTSSTAAPLDYNPSQGVTVTPTAATGTGWAATAAHSGTTKTCAIYYGEAAAPSPATLEGVVECTK
jgi:prepilin-type N-terminal cleavage/methylation domain-containing protein